jgi:predicted P-loop ATPase
MSEQKQNRQQLACDYIHENYVAFNRLRYDLIAQKVQVREDRWRYITNADINSIVCDCCAETGANITAKEILTVLNAGSSYIPRVHPLRDYVRSLKPYTPDQPDWIDMVARQVMVKALVEDAEGNTASGKELWRACFKKWFVAMVASWLKDEVVNHQVLVLIGRQGIFKTTWLERLIPPHLRDYCCKLANATQLSKDDRLRIAEFGLINMDELDAMTPRELSAMKSVITSSDVNERVAYGYTKERRVRLASFCASSNKREFLTDMTGNRRWLPFEVESIQNPFYTTQPYDLMYAEALYLIENDFNYWFELEDIETLEDHNEAFRAQDSEEQLLPILFDIPAEGKGEFMTTAQISERLVSYGNIKKPMSVSQLGMLLGKAGYRAVTRGNRNARVRGWIVYQRNTDEINANKTLLAKDGVTV